jgi:hypothetical protein
MNRVDVVWGSELAVCSSHHYLVAGAISPGYVLLLRLDSGSDVVLSGLVMI